VKEWRKRGKQSLSASTQKMIQDEIPPARPVGKLVFIIPVGIRTQMIQDKIVLETSSSFYHPEAEYSLRWDDPDINIASPITQPILSAKDRNGYLLKNLPEEALPAF